MVFRWSLSNSKSPETSWTLLSILTDFNKAVFWMVFTCPLICMSFSPFIKQVGIFQVHQSQTVSPPLLCSIAFLILGLGRSTYLAFFIFTLWSTRTESPLFARFFFCCHCCCWLWLHLVVRTGLRDLFVSQNTRELCVSHSLEWTLGYAYSTCSYCQVSTFCTILSRLPSSPIHV